MYTLSARESEMTNSLRKSRRDGTSVSPPETPPSARAVLFCTGLPRAFLVEWSWARGARIGMVMRPVLDSSVGAIRLRSRAQTPRAARVQKETDNRTAMPQSLNWGFCIRRECYAGRPALSERIHPSIKTVGASLNQGFSPCSLRGPFDMILAAFDSSVGQSPRIRIRPSRRTTS